MSKELATAKKVSGTGFWMPAVKTAFGPKALPHADRQDTRYRAKKEAERILTEKEGSGQ